MLQKQNSQHGATSRLYSNNSLAKVNESDEAWDDEDFGLHNSRPTSQMIRYHNKHTNYVRVTKFYTGDNLEKPL